MSGGPSKRGDIRRIVGILSTDGDSGARMSGFRCFLSVLVVLLAISAQAAAQTGAEAQAIGTLREDLLRTFQIEGKRGTSIFYTQTYKVKGRRVEFHGSIFGAITGTELNGCEVKIKSEIVDRYFGSIGNNLLGQTQSRYISSAEFKLSSKVTDGLQAVSARPVRQLSLGTNAL